jgi:integrase
MNVMSLILAEASDRYKFTSPYYNIKPLRIPKSDVEPFTLAEVQRILATVREDFRDYFTVRFFTGMRTGEVDGLKWKYVDFERRLILVRETVVLGDEEYTKTDGSQRDIQMSQLVFEALKRQQTATGKVSALRVLQSARQAP